MAFLQPIEGIAAIIIMVALGYCLTAKGWFNREVVAVFPKLVLNISLPAYMIWNLSSTLDKVEAAPLLIGIIVPLISIIAAFLIGYLFVCFLKIRPGRRGIFLAIFTSASAVFLGVPVNVALFGEESVPYVLIYSVANALAFWTIMNYAVGLDGKKPFSVFSVTSFKNIFSPPLMGFIVGIVLALAGIQLPNFITDTCRYLGGMTTPLSMLFIGATLFGVKLNQIRLSSDIVAALFGRFIISGLVVLLVTYFIPIPALMKKVFIIESILPATASTTILAQTHGADVEYASLLVSVTTIFAIIVIPIYMLLI